MSRQLRAFRAGEDRRVLAPYIRGGGVWNNASKVFRKESGTWVEWWPLLPAASTDVVGNFLYRNDNIELDIDWSEPVGGPDIDEYRITVSIDGVGTTWTQVGNATFTPPRSWQEHAGKTARITVVGVSPFGEPGDPAYSPSYVVPQLPPPPDPSGVEIDIVARGATATWVHTGGNRLSTFDLRTEYKGKTNETVASQTARSQDVTFWSTVATPGDPGGSVGFLVRAVGPGGTSSWVGTAGAVSSVANPPALPLPGSVKITNHRFLNGNLRCTFSAPNAVGVKVWWQKYGGNQISQANVASSSGNVTIGASSGWARDEISRYRIVLVGYNSKGQDGPLTYGPWARKLPNPYVLLPSEFVSMRGEYPDGTFYPFSAGYLMNLQIRQGGSYNFFAYRKPEIVWRGYISYREEKLSAEVVGYAPTVTSAQLWLQRATNGGSGQAVSPRQWWHGYGRTNPLLPPGRSLFGPKSLTPLARGQAAWLDIDTGYARKMVDPNDGVKGIAMYSEDNVLRSYLGEVSDTYMIFNGPFAAPFGQACFSMRLYHDG